MIIIIVVIVITTMFSFVYKHIYMTCRNVPLSMSIYARCFHPLFNNACFCTRIRKRWDAICFCLRTCFHAPMYSSYRKFDEANQILVVQGDEAGGYLISHPSLEMPPSIHQHTYITIHPSIHPSIYLSIHPYMNTYT